MQEAITRRLERSGDKFYDAMVKSTLSPYQTLLNSADRRADFLGFRRLAQKLFPDVSVAEANAKLFDLHMDAPYPAPARRNKNKPSKFALYKEMKGKPGVMTAVAAFVIGLGWSQITDRIQKSVDRADESEFWTAEQDQEKWQGRMDLFESGTEELNYEMLKVWDLICKDEEPAENDTVFTEALEQIKALPVEIDVTE